MKYSQNEEESVILNYFNGYIGTFLDLGSYTGIELSNVRALAEIGWSGIMVEASPTIFDKLKNNYEGFKKISLHNCAVGSTTGVLLFYDNHNAVGSLHKHETERWGNTEQFNIIDVPCIEINEFIGIVSSSIKPMYEFISIDVEGEDYQIVKRLNLKELNTKLICVEFNSKDKELYDNIIVPQGFHLIYQNLENLIYAIN